MSYEVVYANKYYLKHFVEEISLEDSLEEIAYRANIRLAVASDLPIITPGQEIRVSGIAYGGSQMSYLLNPGVVWECESSNNGTKHLSVTVYDRTIYLAKSEDELLLPTGQTASQRLRQYAQSWDIPIGNVPDTKIVLARSVKRSQSIFSMMMEDLKETADKGGDLYRPRMTPNGLELAKLGNNAKVWELEYVQDTTQKRTLEGAVTQVKVLGSQGGDTSLSPVLAVVKGETDKYGTLQKVLQDCKIETAQQAREAANRTLLGMQETFSVNAPDINTLRAGDRVKLNGMELFVTNVRHQLGEPGQMQLELAKEAKVRRDWCA
ncbi:XkdQ/YqbQ family protein [Cohnella nanjingensis]|uniref:Phage portal protein n=1 Tax=Cohnella nanjingensis TaxID=1387779 RepID=A0A7X0RVM1_9BACL|nr:phage portal protein [Cohnella nanjingensis]MBB6674507.1 phage portal protein [Cohnella nanjingensis]